MENCGGTAVMDSDDKSYKKLQSLLENPGTVDGLFLEETKRLLEDLRLHQTELQDQNEELRRAQQILQEHRRRLANLYDHAPVAYLTFNTKGLIEQANLTASALLGVPGQKLVGTPFQQYVHPKYTDKYFEYLARVMLDGENSSCELRLRKHGGTLFWGRVESVPVEPFEGEEALVRSAVIDITQRKEAEEALRESEEKYRVLVESAQVIILRLDNEGRVVFLNDYGRKFFGYSPEELWTKGVVGTIVAREDAVGLNVKELLAFMTKHPENYRARELDNIRRNGERARVSWTISVLHDEEGFFAGILAVGTDITPRRRLEEQLRQSQKMEAIGTLAGGIAHDFNNMLAAILGFTEMAMEDTSDRPEVTKSLGHVTRAAIRARDLVKQILAFSRKAEYTRDPLSVVPIIKETVHLLRSSIPATVEIKLDVSAASDMVLASPTEIQQILMNLATNAFLAMQEKGGILEISLTDVDLEQGYSMAGLDVAHGDYLQLTVSDTGAGMSPEVAKRIFEPFFTTREVGKGTGMGLAVVYGIVNDLRGMIAVESKPGAGSVFRVFLPKVDADVQERDAKASEIIGGKERILFVDDEKLLVEWGRVTLERLGYKVTSLANGTEAINIFRANPFLFDLVITDQTMPGMSGIQLASELLAIRHDLPIILCTGHSDAVSPESAKEVGVREYLMKPLSRKELAGAVRKVLDKTRE